MKAMSEGGKIRVDLLLVERGLVQQGAGARADSGRAGAGAEQKVDKPGTTVPADAPVRLLGDDPPYVSRAV